MNPDAEILINPFDCVLEHAQHIKENRLQINLQTIQLEIKINELDRKSPKYIKHILTKNKLISLKTKLETIGEILKKQESQIKSSVPFFYKIGFKIRNLFKSSRSRRRGKITL